MDAPGRLEELRVEFGAEVVAMIVAAFAEDARSHLDGLREAAIAGDFQTVRRTAHSVGGAAANVGADELARRARSLEQHGGAMTPLAMRTEIAVMVAELAAWMDAHARQSAPRNGT